MPTESLHERIKLTLAISDVIDALYRFDDITFADEGTMYLMKAETRAILKSVKRLNDLADTIHPNS